MARWQIDLVDFRTCPDGEYKWICNVQDHFTKFCWLKPLKSKCAEEVAQVLYELMGTYGSPCILQSDNGKEFRNSVVYNLKKLWHNLKIIHGRPRHPQSQGSVERSNGDIQGIFSWVRVLLNVIVMESVLLIGVVVFWVKSDAILSVIRNRLNVKTRLTELSRMKSYRSRVTRKSKNIIISYIGYFWTIFLLLLFIFLILST